MNAMPRAYVRTRFFDPAEKAGIGLEPVLEPVVPRLEADQHTGRFAVARDDDFLPSGLTQEAREVIFDLGIGGLPSLRTSEPCEPRLCLRLCHECHDFDDSAGNIIEDPDLACVIGVPDGIRTRVTDVKERIGAHSCRAMECHQVSPTPTRTSGL